MGEQAGSGHNLDKTDEPVAGSRVSSRRCQQNITSLVLTMLQPTTQPSSTTAAPANASPPGRHVLQQLPVTGAEAAQGQEAAGLVDARHSRRGANVEPVVAGGSLRGSGQELMTL